KTECHLRVILSLEYFKNRFFFFQAEDGIRVKLVTGVQTCALPISPGPPRRAGAWESCSRPPRTPPASSPRWTWCASRWTRRRARSEERRVGKEGGGRGRAWQRRRKRQEQRIDGDVRVVNRRRKRRP